MKPKISADIVPEHVKSVLGLLCECGFTPYIVGGAPRDILLGLTPHDWDLASDALPAEVLGCAGDRFECLTFGERHGTITLAGDSPEPWRVEVTTFRKEGAYSDGRRPDRVCFVPRIEDDLSRRDFTVNAIALSWPRMQWIDPFEGALDIRRRLVRTVGDAAVRFGEDGLRLLRAVRLVAERGWRIEKHTYNAIRQRANLLNKISKERIRDEFSRIMTGDFVSVALFHMQNSGLLTKVIPEFAEVVGYDQKNRHHRRKLDDHIVDTVRRVPGRLVVRLAALLHDIAKPRSFSLDSEGQGRFYGHARTGAEMAAEILRRLRYDKDTIKSVSTLVAEHMFSYGPNLSDAGVRRLIKRVGVENLADLFELRRADVLASGGLTDPGLDRVWERVTLAVEGSEPVDTLDLAIDGNDVMQKTGWPPGPDIGKMLTFLLESVIEEPSLNTRERLMEIVEKKAAQESTEPRE